MNSLQAPPSGETAAAPAPGPPPARDPAIVTDKLGHRYGRHWAVRDLDLVVPRGAVYGFLGLNGAGKSTTIRMLLGLIQPHAGSASVLGFDPRRDDILIKRRVGYVPDTPAFYDWMTVAETFAFVSHYRKGEWDDARAKVLADLFEVPLAKPTGELSRGQRAKVALILALAFHPELLLLDEPTLGLDPVARRQFVQGLLAEFMEGDRTVLISSHLISEISGIVDHVGILKGGHLIRHTRVDDLLGGLKRIRLLFENDPPAGVTVDGLLRTDRSGRELLLLVDGYHPERVMGTLKCLNTVSVSVEDLSLEEAFIELAGKEEEK